MPVNMLDYTGPENRGECGFCGKEEGGYAKKDANGKWQAACWLCVRPTAASAPQPKRNTVGTVFTDTDLDEPETPKKNKSKGMAPSTTRPKTI
jgi:hypothetical protein